MTDRSYARSAMFGLALLVLAPLPVHADAVQAVRDQVPGKLINDPTSIAWNMVGSGATRSVIKGANIPGGGALQITIPVKGANAYDVGLLIPLTRGFAKGSHYVISFYARTVMADTTDGNGVIAVRFQQNAAPYSGFGETKRTIGKGWQLYEVPVIANIDVPASLAVVSLQLSGAKQVLQIGQAIVQEGAVSILQPTPANQDKCASTTPILPATMAGKGDVMTDINALNWGIFGAGESHERIVSCGVPGDSAYRFTIAAAGVNPFDITANVQINRPIKSGDTLMIGIVGRTKSAETTDGEGVVTLRVQQDAAGYPGFGDRTLTFGPAWQLKRFTVEADRDIPAGQATLTLQLAGAKQVIDLGRAYVIQTVPAQP